MNRGKWTLGPITWGRCCLSLRLHVESRFYVSSNCTLTWLFPKWVKCGDSTSAKSMQHFHLNDELDSRSLQFIRHRCISFGVFCVFFFFLFSFLAKALSSRKTKTQNWACMSAYPSQTLLRWHISRAFTSSCYHLDALVAGRATGLQRSI